jgi:hypothetical protein
MTMTMNEGCRELVAAVDEQLAALDSMRHATSYLAKQLHGKMTKSEALGNIMARAVLIALREDIIKEWQDFLSEVENGARERKAICGEGSESGSLPN